MPSPPGINVKSASDFDAEIFETSGPKSVVLSGTSDSSTISPL